MFAHRLNLEDNSEIVKIGKAIMKIEQEILKIQRLK